MSEEEDGCGGCLTAIMVVAIILLALWMYGQHETRIQKLTERVETLERK